jgi:hypothetical protein
MKLSVLCVLLGALAAPVFAATASVGSAGAASTPTKPSSFAPHPVPAGHAYGAPIQSQILHKRQRHKSGAATRASP